MVHYCRSPVCLTAKTVIVTGSSSGIGYETALDFAKRGARVILACRSEAKAEEAKIKIIQTSNNDNVVVKLLNLESLKSVREFAQDINTTEERLDILVNNAGSAYLPEKLTEDGLQLQTQVNYFSMFVLTHLLIGLLKKSAPSRIVNVASASARVMLSFDPKKINNFPGNTTIYRRSKLCVIYFTQLLAKKLEGTGVTTYSLHPGATSTEFFRYSKLSDLLAKMCLTAEQGAQTSIYLAVEKDIEKYSGMNFASMVPIPNYRIANCPEKAQELWDITENLVKLRDEEKI